MPGNAGDGKEMSDTAATGGAGFDITSLRFRKAGGQLLHPAARKEVGMDVDATAAALRYVVKPDDAAYADFQPLPFLLVVADPEGSEQVW